MIGTVTAHDGDPSIAGTHRILVGDVSTEQVDGPRVAAVAIVLGFIGSKMVAEYFGIYVPTEFSLGVVLTFLSSGVGLSIYSKNQKKLENSQR